MSKNLEPSNIEIKEGAWPVSSFEISMLVGQILTLSDSWSENETVTKARKDLLTQNIYRWWTDIQMNKEGQGLETVKFKPHAHTSRAVDFK